ncbi:MAG TPA: hypothetical protein VGM06_02655 [Polyangiaceae bacterium]
MRLRNVLAGFVVLAGTWIVSAPGPGRPEEGRRGCCSHHQGVCGCSAQAHRLVCCDQQLSPSCKC